MNASMVRTEKINDNERDTRREEKKKSYTQQLCRIKIHKEEKTTTTATRIRGKKPASTWNRTTERTVKHSKCEVIRIESNELS